MILTLRRLERKAIELENIHFGATRGLITADHYRRRLFLYHGMFFEVTVNQCMPQNSIIMNYLPSQITRFEVM